MNVRVNCQVTLETFSTGDRLRFGRSIRFQSLEQDPNDAHASTVIISSPVLAGNVTSDHLKPFAELCCAHALHATALICRVLHSLDVAMTADKARFPRLIAKASLCQIKV